MIFLKIFVKLADFENYVLVYNFEICYSIEILKARSTIQDFEKCYSIED